LAFILQWISCDDSAVAIVDSNGNILSEVVSSQWDLLKEWKGTDGTIALGSRNFSKLIGQELFQPWLLDRTKKICHWY
jgi:tRNA A37 threonylcarbamoyltransferase TsaD